MTTATFSESHPWAVINRAKFHICAPGSYVEVEMCAHIGAEKNLLCITDYTLPFRRNIEIWKLRNRFGQLLSRA